MDESKIVHCRFCAESKSSDKMLDILSDESKYAEVSKKLNFLNAVYVNVNKDNYLPKTVCFVCYESLNNAYDFLDKVKRAQTILNSIYPLDDEFNSSGEDRPGDIDENSNAEQHLIKLEEPIDKSIDENKELQVKHIHKDKNSQENRSKKLLSLWKEYDDFNSSDEDRPVGFDEDSNSGQDLINLDQYTDKSVDENELQVQHASIDEDSQENESENLFRSVESITVWKEYPWICAHCDIEFLDIAKLRLHSKMSHGKCTAFACIDCDNVGSGDFNHFIKHVKIHWRKLRKRCHYCDENLSEDALPSHVEQHFQKDQVACPDCGEILKNKELLQKHLDEYNTAQPEKIPRRKRDTPLTIEDLTCGICNKIYSNPNSLRDHKKYIHNNDRKRNYTCDRCGKMFYNKSTLTSHIMAHNKIRPYTCKICNQSFMFPNKLKHHVDIHYGVKSFSCEQCGKAFRTQRLVNQHKIIHTDSMPYVCQYCNKAFRFKQILNNHYLQHTGAKPYPCKNCGKEFTNWSNHNKHMKRKHGIDTCKKKITPNGIIPINPKTGEMVQFNDAATEEWKAKIRIPAKRGKKGGKPYLCEKCGGREFTSWSGHNKHMKRMHGIDTAKNKLI